jgi:pSer/pThr/pTyr-binding forkhead associated (FHA) protein
MVKAFALGDTDELIIGRDEGCDIRINSASISREHCSIEQNGQDTFLRDLDSSGGTYFDGERINEIRIEDGMEFSIGPAILKFIDSGL